MRRILVVGSSGAGKSTFARRLGAATGIPVVHLDKLYWNPNWVGTTDEFEWRAKIETALSGDAWIVDGNYSGTLELRLRRADTIVFLDLPRVLCVWRVIKRAAFYRKRTRPDVAEGCNERFNREFVKFLHYIWTYPARSKPKVERMMRENQSRLKIVRLKSKREVEKFLSEYERN